VEVVEKSLLFSSADLPIWISGIRIRIEKLQIGNTVHHGITSLLNFLACTVKGKGMPMLADGRIWLEHRVLTPLPPSSKPAMAGRNYLNK
jgi:hypothetical protein